MQAADANPSVAQSLALEVAYLLLDSGEAEQAYSIFVNPPPQGASREVRFALAAAAGHLQYQRWRQGWEAAGSSGNAGSSAGGSPHRPVAVSYRILSLHETLIAKP